MQHTQYSYVTQYAIHILGNLSICPWQGIIMATVKCVSDPELHSIFIDKVELELPFQLQLKLRHVLVVLGYMCQLSS